MNVIRLALASFFAAAALAVEAVEVTPEQAETAAVNWITSKSRRLDMSFGSSCIANVFTARSESGRALYHAVNFEGGGYVVMSADTRLTPVVVFSGTGCYVDDEERPLCGFLMHDQEALIQMIDSVKAGTLPYPGILDDFSKAEAEWEDMLRARSSSGKDSAYGLPDSDMDDICVYPLVRTRWNQRSSELTFNYYTPNNYSCGCVATAAAQVMKFWEWPLSSGKFSELCYKKSVVQTFTSKQGRYAWSLMPYDIHEIKTEAQRQAVGKLAYNIGVAVKMNWGWNDASSGAYLSDLGDAMRNHFDYKEARHMYLGTGLIGIDTGGSVAKLKDLVYPNLDAGMPVILSVRKSLFKGGHAVVADGYGYCGGTRYTHINFGWGGSDDGWYNLVHEKMGEFSRYISVVYNIHPTLKCKTIVSGRVTTNDGTPLAGATVEYCRSDGTKMITTQANARGIYFFRGESLSGEHIVKASYGSKTASRKFTVDSPPNKWEVDFKFDATPSGDLYDPGDGFAWSGALLSRLSPSTTKKTSEQHTLSATDLCDFFSIDAKAGHSVILESTGGADLVGEVFSSEYADEPSCIARSGAAGNFRLEFIPDVTGTYYLKVGCRNPGAAASYRIAYSSHVGDAFDPSDDTPANGTLLVPGSKTRSHESHVIGEDVYDYYRIFMDAGLKYVFYSTGKQNPTCAELFDSLTCARSDRVAVAQGNGIDSDNFMLEYTPVESKMHYLRVGAKWTIPNGQYDLHYSCTAPRDMYDPSDDTPDNGAPLAISTAVKRHGVHTLSASDPYDFFRVELSAGRRYVFESTGTFDMYGELFDSTSAVSSSLVAYDDDSGADLNFKIEYMPVKSDTYYLRVRRNPTGADASYQLNYSYTPVRHTVVFNPNGGSPTPASVTVDWGRAVSQSALPSPSRTGYVFDGWWTAQSGGTKVEASTVVTEDMTCWAHWKSASAQEPTMCELSFLDEKGRRQVLLRGALGTAIGPLPNPYNRPGFSFVGWYRGDEKLTQSSLYKTSPNTAEPRWIELTATVNGYKWCYQVENGKATIVYSGNLYNQPAVAPQPSGAVTVPSTLGGCPVTAIGDYAFYWCDEMTAVTLPETVTSIGDQAFYACKKLKTVNGLQRVKSLGLAAFARCGFTSLNLAGSLGAISEMAFDGCKSLVTVTIGDGVERIERNAFSFCDALTTVNIPASVAYIGKEAFYSSVALKNLNMEGEERSRDASAFRNCFGLADGDFVVVDGVLYNYLGSASRVTIPDGVREIDPLAFYDVYAGMWKTFTELVVPVCLESVGADALDKTGVSRVYIYDPLLNPDAEDPSLSAGVDYVAEKNRIVGVISASGLGSSPTYSMLMRVTFDPCGGASQETSLDVQVGSALGASLNSVPQPTIDEYQFDGWWTEPSGGQRVTSSTRVYSPMTFYAHWGRHAL